MGLPSTRQQTCVARHPRWFLCPRLLSCLQAVVMFFIAGALSGDPFHITMPLLRLSLLLLLLVPMPYPNIAAVWHAATAGVGRQHAGSSWIRWYYPRHYWQSSNFRLVVVVVQRVVTALAAFACVGFRYSAYFESSMRIMYWQGVAKYVFQGWLAWMLVVSCLVPRGFQHQQLIACFDVLC